MPSAAPPQCSRSAPACRVVPLVSYQDEVKCQIAPLQIHGVAGPRFLIGLGWAEPPTSSVLLFQLTMGWRHLLLLLPFALYVLTLLLTTQAAGPPRTPKGNRTQGAGASRRPYKPAKEQLNQSLTSTAPSSVQTSGGGSRGRSPGVGPAKVPSSSSSSSSAGSSSPAYETCMGYYDVSGQWDKEFECNNTQQDFRYCCGTCSFRFCCNKRSKKLNQEKCRNQDPRPSTDPMTPATKNDGPGDIPNGYDPNEDNTNATVYISCGAIAFVVIAGIFAKVAYDKARQPPQEMNIHRALADILRQQGPIPIAHCERETISAIDTSPKDNTPIRTSSKNHYTPVRTSKANPGKTSTSSVLA
ncbi:Protein shisa-6-like protein, partial [Ophiophagus hannah]